MLIERYAKNVVALAEAGFAVQHEQDQAIVVPLELCSALRRDRGALTAFRALGPGQQREYANYVAEAKHENTRRKRSEKVVPVIQNGHGLNDRNRYSGFRRSLTRPRRNVIVRECTP